MNRVLRQDVGQTAMVLAAEAVSQLVEVENCCSLERSRDVGGRRGPVKGEECKGDRIASQQRACGEGLRACYNQL